MHRRTYIRKCGAYSTLGVSSVCDACPILLAITKFFVTKMNALQTQHQAFQWHYTRRLYALAHINCKCGAYST